jgi:hypothetical protein
MGLEGGTVERLLVLAVIAIAVSPAFARCNKLPATAAAAAQSSNLIATLNCAAGQTNVASNALLVERFEIAANSGVTRPYPAVAFAVLAETIDGNSRNVVATPNPKGSAMSLVQCSLEVTDASVLGSCLTGPGTVYVVYHK